MGRAGQSQAPLSCTAQGRPTSWVASARTLGLMTTHKLTSAAGSKTNICDRCGNDLPSADAVCIACDAELSAPLVKGLRSGKHICPGCNSSFDTPDITLEPEGAKWYVPQSQGLRCPHCRLRLLDTRNPRMPPRRIAGLVVLALCTQILLPARYTRTGLIVLALTYLALYLRRRSWGVAESRRYARDEA